MERENFSSMALCYEYLEKVHGIKAYWHEEAIKLTNEIGVVKYFEDDDLDILYSYLRYPALVDNFNLNSERILFWKKMGVFYSAPNLMSRTYHENRMKLTCIGGVSAVLHNLVDSECALNLPLTDLRRMYSDNKKFLQSLEVNSDDYPRSVTLCEVNGITDKLCGLYKILAANDNSR